MNYLDFDNAIKKASLITIVQGENPDGDSLGTSLALEAVLANLKKEVELYCPVNIPKYLHYFDGWDRVVTDIDPRTDLIIIVDTASNVLLSKTLEKPYHKHILETEPVFVIDHHVESEDTLSFDHTLLQKDAVAASEVLYDIFSELNYPINKVAATAMLGAIFSDSLGMTTDSVNANSFYVCSKLLECGAKPAEIEDKRREFMKKSAEILDYKADLIKRIEYYLDNKIALIHIPWEDIQKYSDQYNPSVLVLDEMRLVEDVELAVAFKTYPDGRVTGKLRSNIPISNEIAGYFGGGGHKFAAGFRTYDNYDNVVKELIEVTNKVIESYKNGTLQQS